MAYKKIKNRDELLQKVRKDRDEAINKLAEPLRGNSTNKNSTNGRDYSTSVTTSGTRTKLSEGRKAQLADSRKKTAEKTSGQKSVNSGQSKEELQQRKKEFKRNKRAENRKQALSNMNISAYLDNEGGVFEGKKGISANDNKKTSGQKSVNSGQQSEKSTSLKDRYKAIKEDVRTDTKRYRENDYYGVQKADSPFTEDERKSIQAKAEKEKEESDGLKKELEYARTRHSAFTKNGKWENAKKESENIKELEGKIKEKDKSVKQWQDLAGTKVTDRAANAAKGIIYGIPAAEQIIRETGKAAINDYIRNGKNKEAQEAKRKWAVATTESGNDFEELMKMKKAAEEKENRTVLGSDSRAMKNYANTLSYNEEALRGLEGSDRMLGEALISTADNAALMPLAAINPSLPLAVMSSKAAAGRMYELNNDGKSAGESFSRGVLSGAIEAATEKTPLENLYAMVRSGGKGVLKNILTQAGLEATEEAMSYTANYIADKAARDPKAKWSWQDFLTQAAEGGISGGIFGAGGVATGRVLNGTRSGNESADYSKGYVHYEGNDGNIYSLPKKDLSIQNLSEGIQKVDGFLNKLREDNARKAQYIAKEFGGMEYDAENIEKLKLYAGLENSDARTLDDIVREVAEGRTKKSKAREEMYMAGRKRLVEALGNVLAEGEAKGNSGQQTVVSGQQAADSGRQIENGQANAFEGSEQINPMDQNNEELNRQNENRRTLRENIEEDAAPERQAKYREIVGRYAGEKTIGNMDKLAKRLGSEVVYYLGDDSSEGFYENGKIYLNANLVDVGKNSGQRSVNSGQQAENGQNSTNANYWKIFKHEFTHAIEDSKAFKKDFTDWSLASGLYSEFIKNQGFIDEEGNADKAAYADSIRELYRKNGQELDDNGLNRELMAKFVQESDLFENEDSINRLVNENRGFGQRILEWIRNTINKIKGVDPTAENMLKEAERLYEKAVRETEKKGARNSGKQYSVKTPKGYYDYSKSFAEQIDDFKDGKFPRTDTLIVGRTPKVLRNLGFNELPITINQKHIDYMLNNTKDLDHYIGETNLKKLPKIIEKPIAVIKSQSKGNPSVVMLLDFIHNGKTVITPVYIDGYGMMNFETIDSNAAGSTYARGNAETKLLLDAIKNDSNSNPQVFYIDTKKAAGLLQSRGYQLPNPLFLSNGYVHNITDANANINRRFENVTQTQQFKRWFGDWENEKRNNKKVSKVVDDKGKPKKLYHQTDAEIEAFDTSRKGSGYYDSQTPEGIFLKTTNKDIGLKGKKQIEVYADIKNPLVVENRTALETWAKVDSKYKNAIDEAKAIDKKNEARYNELEAEDECERFLKEWKKEVNKANRKARVRLTELIKSKGYDGVHIKNDEGSFGRNIETWIAFKSNQVKSTDNLGTFDKNNPKIQYSFRQTNEELAESRMNAKAQSYTNKAVNKLLKSFKDSIGMTTYADKGIKEDIRQFANEYVEKGGMSEEEVNKVFDKLYENAMTFNTEYYDQYKDLKQALRTTKINIGAIKGTVAKDLGRGLRWSYDKGALGSDSFYQELSEQYPELFPENIINPEDQLEKMRDVAESIKPTEERLRDLGINYGSSVEERAREAFNTAVEDMNESLADVINFKRERGKRAEAKEQRRAIVDQMHTNIKETKKIFSTSKDLNKKLAKLKNRYLWTEADGNALQRVLNGEITLDELPKNANKKAVNAVYETAKAAAETDQRLKDYKRGVAEQRRDMARELTINSNKYVDKKSGFQWESETPDRNFEDLAKETGDGKKLAEAYIKPIHENEAKATRMKNEYRKKLSEFKLDTKPKYEIRSVDVNGNPVDKLVSESGLVQAYGEGIINGRDLENFKADKEKIKNAAKAYRQVYDELIDMSNDALVRNGYAPVERRKNYFPHFTETSPDTLLGKIGAMLGVDIAGDDIRTDIAGITENFRPGKKWVGNFLERKGDITEYDAMKGFDRYIDSVADVIWHTDDIQNLRALSTELRYKYSDEGIQQKIADILANDVMDESEKASEIRGNLEDLKEHPLGNFVTWLDNYTNILAGKKSYIDRPSEKLSNRRMYQVMKGIEGKIQANMVGANISSALTNFIPITQVSGMVDNSSILKALIKTSANAKKSDNIWLKSDFLTNRKGTEALYRDDSTLIKSAGNKINDLAAMPFGFVDGFTSEVVYRSLYYDALKKGMSESTALEYANDWAARVMADRSKGATPTIFNTRNPLTKVFTMFQVEVNNQYRYYFKDLPKEKKDKGLAALAGAFFKMFLGAYLYNDVYELFFGRRAAFDPLGKINDAQGRITGKKLDNTFKIVKSIIDGKAEPLAETPKESTGEAIVSTGKDVAEDMPYIGGVLGGGRVPISGALPDAAKIAETTFSDTSGKKKGEVLAKELAKPLYYIAMPMGGGQIKKMVEGISTVKKGGEYTYDKDGNEQLKFPVEKTSKAKTAGRYIQGAIGGKSALPEAQRYYSQGLKALTAKQTQNYHKVVEAGLNYDTFLKWKARFDEIDETATKNKSEKKRQELFDDKSLTAKQKKVLDQAFINDTVVMPKDMDVDYTNESTFKVTQMSDSAQEGYKTVKRYGISGTTYEKLYNDLSEIKGDKVNGKSVGAGTKAEKNGEGKSASLKKKEKIDSMKGLSKEQKEALYEAFGVSEKVW